eukprot:1977503-Pyramimonas_sp.AAC.1
MPRAPALRCPPAPNGAPRWLQCDPSRDGQYIPRWLTICLQYGQDAPSEPNIALICLHGCSNAPKTAQERAVGCLHEAMERTASRQPKWIAAVVVGVGVVAK